MTEKIVSNIRSYQEKKIPTTKTLWKGYFLGSAVCHKSNCSSEVIINKISVQKKSL